MKQTPARSGPSIALIIPACEEEACLAQVLEELLRQLDPERFVVAVGVNGSSDRTAEIARRYPVLVAETKQRGYGYGCRAAIERVISALPAIEAYVFFAADGASPPLDVKQLVAAHEQGYEFVLGSRTTRLANWPIMSFSHVIANMALALWCGLLTGRPFKDLAPLRLISRQVFDRLALCEMTFGWTIEAQIGAALSGVRICEIGAGERRRIAGVQKVSGVTWKRTFAIGCRIVVAGWRARRRYTTARKTVRGSATEPTLLPQPHRGV